MQIFRSIKTAYNSPLTWAKWFQLTFTPGSFNVQRTKTKLRGLSPRANYTDRATASCRWS
jgi:hypothetical protein